MDWLTGVWCRSWQCWGVLAYLLRTYLYNADYPQYHVHPLTAANWSSAAALVGALVGFLWYFNLPAQTSWATPARCRSGGIIAVFALCIRKELLLPLLCGVFFWSKLFGDDAGRLLQIPSANTAKATACLLMAPVHHHFQKKGQFETKIVLRF